MADDSHLFRTQSQLAEAGGRLQGNVFVLNQDVFWPLYEPKLIHQFDHRYATFSGVANASVLAGNAAEVESKEKLQPLVSPMPRYWVKKRDAEATWKRISNAWFVAIRGVTAATNERTFISAVIPAYAAQHNMWLLSFNMPAANVACLLGNFNTMVFDNVARAKTGSYMSQFVVKQLPVLPPRDYSKRCKWSHGYQNLREWLLPRILELTYTAWDLEPFAQDCGCFSPPFRWDEDRRYLLRCELDAAFFHLYLPAEANGAWQPAERETPEDRARLKASFSTPGDAVAYIMETFPIVKRKDEAKFGEFRTKRVILEIYNAMAEAARTGIPYATRLDPPPADPSCCHPKKKIGILAFGSLITDPGAELQSRIIMRIKTKTRFPVEYARISRSRGGAPTLVPHESGASVSAEILVLADDISIEDAANMLFRREFHITDQTKTYTPGDGPNNVVIGKSHDTPWVETVLYTDFNPSGKTLHPAAKLAKKAIASVATAGPEMDGITYLMKAMHSGIVTPLTAAYETEILRQTVTITLEDALKQVKGTQCPMLAPAIR